MSNQIESEQNDDRESQKPKGERKRFNFSKSKGCFRLWMGGGGDYYSFCFFYHIVLESRKCGQVE